MITTTDITSRKVRFVDLFSITNNGILDRYASRTGGLWAPYATKLVRANAAWDAQVFSLRSAGHRYALIRLEQVSLLELQSLLVKFDRAIIGIAAEAQRWVIEETAKRYEHTVEMAILEAKVATRELGLQEKRQQVDAKIAALEADDYALAVEQERLRIAQGKYALRVDELEAQLRLLDVDASMVEIDILREQQRALQAELDIVKTQLRGLELQQAIAKVALTIAQEQVRRAEVQTDIVELQVRREKEGLVETEQLIEQDRLDNMRTETDHRQTVREAQEAHRAAHHKIISDYLDKLYKLHKDKAGYSQDETLARALLAITSAEGQLDHALAERKFSLDERKGRINVATIETNTDTTLRKIGDRIYGARIRAAREQADAAIDAAEILAHADIASALQHTVARG